MERKIRLTESEFHNLVRRLVNETKDEMNKKNKVNINDVILDELEDKIEDLSLNKINSIINKLENLKDSLSPSDKKTSVEDIIDNNAQELDEEDDDLETRRFNRRKKIKVGVGISASALGMLGMASQAIGYVDGGKLMIAIHDAYQSVGGRYTPNLSLGVLIGGIIYAFHSVAQEKEKKEKIKENYYRNRRYVR